MPSIEHMLVRLADDFQFSSKGYDWAHPYMKKLVERGEETVAYIRERFDRINYDPSHGPFCHQTDFPVWLSIALLKRITRTDPVPIEDRGYVGKAFRAWKIHLATRFV